MNGIKIVKQLISLYVLATSSSAQKHSYLRLLLGRRRNSNSEEKEDNGKQDCVDPVTFLVDGEGVADSLSSRYKIIIDHFKPKANKILSFIELWTLFRQNSLSLNE